MQFAMTRKGTILAVVASAAVVGPAALLAGPAQAKTYKAKFTSSDPNKESSGLKVAGPIVGTPWGKATMAGKASDNFATIKFKIKAKGGTATCAYSGGKLKGAIYTAKWKCTKGTGKFKGIKASGKVKGDITTAVFKHTGTATY